MKRIGFVGLGQRKGNMLVFVQAVHVGDDGYLLVGQSQLGHFRSDRIDVDRVRMTLVPRIELDVIAENDDWHQDLVLQRGKQSEVKILLL
jgi:hypothetical protein